MRLIPMPKPLSNLSDAELLAVANQTVIAMTPNPGVYGTTVADLTALVWGETVSATITG
jgi:hypothetical protein